MRQRRVCGWASQRELSHTRQNHDFACLGRRAALARPAGVAGAATWAGGVLAAAAGCWAAAQSPAARLEPLTRLGPRPRVRVSPQESVAGGSGHRIPISRGRKPLTRAPQATGWPGTMLTGQNNTTFGDRRKHVWRGGSQHQRHKPGCPTPGPAQWVDPWQRSANQATTGTHPTRRNGLGPSECPSPGLSIPSRHHYRPEPRGAPHTAYATGS